MKGRVLVVDDVELNRDALAGHLERVGFEVQQAECGSQVLSALDQSKFDIILLDIMMPDVDGLEVLVQVRRRFSMAALPVVMVSALDETDVLVEAFRLGANDYVTKPIDVKVTLARIESLLARSRVGPAPAEEPTSAAQSVSVMQTLAVKSAELPLGTMIGNYRLGRVLGRGGMGIVYEVEDQALHRTAALKLLNDLTAADDKLTHRFRREARAAARVEHPNVVGIYEVGVWQNRFYMAMQLVDGETASERVAAHARLSWQEASKVIRDASAGLAAAHARHVLHRDVKPANILLGRDGSVKLMDFGLAKIGGVGDHGTSTGSGAVMGTPHFMSPEQCRTEAVDERSDVYQMGATYFNLLTGVYPYGNHHHFFEILDAHCNAPVPDPGMRLASIPGPCARIAMRCMQKAPQDRYQSVTDLVAELDRLLD